MKKVQDVLQTLNVMRQEQDCLSFGLLLSNIKYIVYVDCSFILHISPSYCLLPSDIVSVFLCLVSECRLSIFWHMEKTNHTGPNHNCSEAK